MKEKVIMSLLNNNTAKKAILSITKGAEEEIIKQIKERGGNTQGIKISIITKGCTGLSYDLTFFDQENPSDELITGEGYKISLDPKSLLYLVGTQLDYVKNDLGEEGFVFVNPNSKGSCGCGESFYV